MKIIRAGRAVLSSEQVVDVVLSSAAYAKAFVEANSAVARLRWPKERVEQAIGSSAR